MPNQFSCIPTFKKSPNCTNLPFLEQKPEMLSCPRLPSYLIRLLEEREIVIKDIKLPTASTWMTSLSLCLLYYAKNVKEWHGHISL